MTKEQIKSYLNKKVKVKIKRENKFKHGILDKIDYYIFGGFDCGEYEAIWLKQNSKTLIIRLNEIETLKV